MDTLKITSIPKIPTGINGLDEITEGGFPQGRPILICGSAGCGKTLFATQFLVKGITDYDEPGVFMSFEESGKDLVENVQSLGFDLEKLVADNKLRLDHVRIERSEIEETGEYDLEGLFIRLNYAIDSIGAKRVVLDTIESMFAGMDNVGVLRSEIRRLFQWLSKRCDRSDHRRTGRQLVDASGIGRVRIGLRYFIGFSGHQSNCHASVADRKIPRIHAWHE
jgi:circadian clock protein KaiC